MHGIEIYSACCRHNSTCDRDNSTCNKQLLYLIEIIVHGVDIIVLVIEIAAYQQVLFNHGNVTREDCRQVNVFSWETQHRLAGP